MPYLTFFAYLLFRRGDVMGYVYTGLIMAIFVIFLVTIILATIPENRKSRIRFGWISTIAGILLFFPSVILFGGFFGIGGAFLGAAVGCCLMLVGPVIWIVGLLTKKDKNPEDDASLIGSYKKKKAEN